MAGRHDIGISGATGVVLLGMRVWHDCLASHLDRIHLISRYIGSGSGRGNPFGLAAVGAITFPVAMFFRIHFPGPVLTAVFAPVTFALVLGYVSQLARRPLTPVISKLDAWIAYRGDLGLGRRMATLPQC